MKIIYIKIILIIFLISFADSYSAKDTLRVGLIKYKRGDIAANTYKPLIDYIAKKLDKVPSLKVLGKEQLGFDLSNNYYDIGIFTPFPYLESKIHFSELEPFATNLTFGSDNYKGAIIVKKNSGIETLYDLKGKKFAFIRPTSTSGYQVPKSIFQEYNIDIDSSFFEYLFSRSQGNSVDLLIADSVSGIAIDLEELDNYPQEVTENFKILVDYIMPNQAYVFSPAMSPELKNQIRNIMFDAHKDPSTQAMFNNELGIQGWVPANDETFNPLRRYLRLIRIKPYAKIEYDIAESALKALREKGDILEIIQDNIEDEIVSCNRFAEKSPNHENVDNYYRIKVSLSRIEKGFFYQIYLNDNRIEKGVLKEKELITSLHSITINSLLNTMDLKAELIATQDKWFITYGHNDGLNPKDYIFLMEGNNETPLLIDSITDLNTFLRYTPDFEKGKEIVIKYTRTGKQLNYSGFDALTDGDESVFDDFWSNLDNIWGVIGLIVVVFSFIFGVAMNRYKHKRFTNMLHKSNDLLKDYIEGKYKIESRLLEQRDLINRGLEEGHFSENQFLILKNRLEDIQNIIENQNIKQEIHRPEIKTEIDKILEDGKITEKEYSRIMSIISKIGK